MKLLLIDDEERLVMDMNVDITDFHIKSIEPEYENREDFLIVPIGEQSFKLDLKADFVVKDNVAFRLYPERVKDADLKIKTCYTRGKKLCSHEMPRDHLVDCGFYGCVCE